MIELSIINHCSHYHMGHIPVSLKVRFTENWFSVKKLSDSPKIGFRCKNCQIRRKWVHKVSFTEIFSVNQHLLTENIPRKAKNQKIKLNLVFQEFEVALAAELN